MAKLSLYVPISNCPKATRTATIQFNTPPLHLLVYYIKTHIKNAKGGLFYNTGGLFFKK